MSARGAVTVEIDGKNYRMALTLGALEDIEVGLGIEDLGELQARLSKPRGRDIITLLTALIRGGGHDVTDEDVRQFHVSVDIMGKIAEAINAGFGGQSENPPEAAPARKSRGAAGKR